MGCLTVSVLSAHVGPQDHLQSSKLSIQGWSATQYPCVLPDASFCNGSVSLPLLHIIRPAKLRYGYYIGYRALDFALFKVSAKWSAAAV